jgi:hypothetical protein
LRAARRPAIPSVVKVRPSSCRRSSASAVGSAQQTVCGPGRVPARSLPGRSCLGCRVVQSRIARGGLAPFTTYPGTAFTMLTCGPAPGTPTGGSAYRGRSARASVSRRVRAKRLSGRKPHDGVVGLPARRRRVGRCPSTPCSYGHLSRSAS